MTVCLISGESRSGRASAFYPDAPSFHIRTSLRQSNGSTEEQGLDTPSENIAYVGFLKDTANIERPAGVEHREFDIHIAGGKKLTVEVNPEDVSQPVGFYSYPLSKFSLYAELFFFAAGVNATEDKEPLGSILMRSGATGATDIHTGLAEQQANRNMPIGQILVEQQAVGEEEVKEAVKSQEKAQHKGKPMRLGEFLVDAGLATESDITTALAEQKKRRGKRLGEVLVELGIVTEAAVSTALAKKFHLPNVDLDHVELVPEAFDELPRELIERYRIFPFQSDDKRFYIAMSDPLAMEAIDMLRFSNPKRIMEVIATPSQIEDNLKIYLDTDSLDADGEMGQILDDLKEEQAADGQEFAPDGDELVSDSAVTRLVNRMIIDAYRRGASDIHVEPYGKDKSTVTRFRVDGHCEKYQKIPSSVWSNVVARIKIMSNLDITERRKPQDGKIKFKLGKKQIELRVATIPTVNGNEDVVMRILAAGKPMPLDQMGFSDVCYEGTLSVVSKPYGLILCVGPTGSGKTTTLHSMLGHINTTERKIWTAEDPVEITQHGLRQVQVHPAIGFNFAAAMRAFLRADPDVIMVGEMRDQETASMGVEASLTGHLVLSTLHTNSAPETITRLVDMGLDPFTFSDALLGVLAQRLARRLCTKCKTSYEATPEELREMMNLYGEGAPEALQEGAGLQLWKAVGCEKCRGTGYKGRFAIHELLINDDELRLSIQRKETVEHIRQLAINGGMRTLLQDGIEKCISGISDLKQVLSVCSR